MRYILSALVLCFLSCATAPKLSDDGFDYLFDGKTFQGWEGDKSFFRIEENAIVAGSLEKKIPVNQFLCTELSFSDFEAHLKVKFNSKENNAGVQIRSERIPNDHEVIGYQADVGFVGDDPVWGSLYDESRRNKFLQEAEKAKVLSVIKQQAYNDYHIKCKGNQIQLSINGTLLLDYTEKDTSIKQMGKICVQIHGGHPAEAWYKEIKIKTL